MTSRQLPFSIPGFSEDKQKELQNALEHLFDNDDLSKITEIPSNMIMHFIRLDIVKNFLDSLGDDEAEFDPIGTFIESYMKYMISRNRQGREEVLKAANAIGRQDNILGEATA